MNPWLLVIQAVVTWYMVGLIWMVQVVHYPLFARVGAEHFVDYETWHQRLITPIVLPPMVMEAVLALLLVVQRPAGVSANFAWLGLALVGMIWGSTFLLQVPRHEELARAFTPQHHELLVASNWLRTLAWSGRGLMMGWLLAHLLADAPP